jgi:hypothetical protein
MQLRDRLIADHAGTMPPDCAALLGEAAEALRLGARLREEAEGELFTRSARSGRSYAHPGISLADVEIRRAALLIGRADALVKSRQPVERPEPEPDPFAELDAIERGEGRRADRSRRNRK